MKSNVEEIFQIAKSLDILNEDDEILFDKLFELKLIIVYTNKLVWIQPYDKGVILEGLKIISEKDFFKNLKNEIRYLDPFVKKISNYV